MTSRSTSALHRCLICTDKKVTVTGRSETGRKLILKLLRCLSLAQQLKFNRETYDNINLCFKCKYALEEWTSAQEEAGSGFLANRARQIKANFLVKILESYQKSTNPPSSASQKIQRLIYDRFNVSVNVDRLEPSCEPSDEISQQETIRLRNPADFQDSDSSEGPDDLDRSSSSGSSSDVEILEDEGEKVVQIFVPRTRTLASANIFEDDDDAGRVISASNDLDQERRQNDETNFKLAHPIPPDFRKAAQDSCSFGKCLIKRVADSFNCSECLYSIAVDSALPLWQMREHMRAQHQDRVPRLPYKRDTLLGPIQKIGSDYQYGVCVLSSYNTEVTEEKTLTCTTCKDKFTGQLAANSWRLHVLRHHEELAPSLPDSNSLDSLCRNGELFQFGAVLVEKLKGSLARCRVCCRELNGELSLRRHVVVNHPEFAPLVPAQRVREGLKWKLKLREIANRKAAANQSSKQPDQRIKANEHLPPTIQSEPTYSKKSNLVPHTKTSTKSIDLGKAQANEDEEESENESDQVDGQDDIDPVENFQKSYPIPPDFIPDKHKLGSYVYGKVNAMEAENGAKCCKCSFSVPMETDGVSSWWKIREHMRNEHPELVPCIAPLKDLKIKSIGEDKFQYGKATITKFMELDVECHKCDICGETYRKKFGRKCCADHIRRAHPEVARFNPYCQETPVLIKKNLIRYAAAYLKKLSDTKVMCLVCSFVSTGQHAQKSSICHVRVRHSVLAPVAISTISQKNQPTEAEEVDENEGEDDIDPIEKFQKTHPIPPDFIPDKEKSGSYLYGKCSAVEAENEAKCCECSFSVPIVETDDVSCWWKVREHMRNKHPELVPCIPPLKDLGMKCIGQDKYQYGEAIITKFLERDVECYKCDTCGEKFQTKFAQKCSMNHIRKFHSEAAPHNPYYHEKPIFIKKNLIRFAAAYLKKLSDTKVMCQVCSFVSTGEHAQKSSLNHVRKQHSVLGPLVIGTVSQASTKPSSHNPSQKTLKRNRGHAAPIMQALRNHENLTEATPTRPKRKCTLESPKKNTEDANGSASDEESSSSSSSDESDDPTTGVFIPNPFRSYGFECPLCGDRRAEKDNFILHLKWHAGRVDEDSPRHC